MQIFAFSDRVTIPQSVTIRGSIPRYVEELLQMLWKQGDQKAWVKSCPMSIKSCPKILPLENCTKMSAIWANISSPQALIDAQNTNKSPNLVTMLGI